MKTILAVAYTVYCVVMGIALAAMLLFGTYMGVLYLISRFTQP